MLQGTATTPRSFDASLDRVAERTIEPGGMARAAARIGARGLDRKLIAGADPAGSAELAARAYRLTSPRHRASVAYAIERLVQSAYEPPNLWGVVPQRRAVIKHADELAELAALLRSRSPLYARGIAMLGRLLADGTGPAYTGRPEALEQRLREARTALAG
jgi:hypothetical protein